IHPRAVRLIGLVILFNAVLIILPIPLGNTLPAMAVMSVALGLISRDGAAVAAGFGLSVTALAASAALVGGAVWLADILMRE
ncbi:MAG TPA: exopolysaccharide biosynthesis protein, partial [Rhodospirillales bacterium]|nr:exopolysaccharide biosynthesis protein [Rhodospirillales bacterium]